MSKLEEVRAQVRRALTGEDLEADLIAMGFGKTNAQALARSKGLQSAVALSKSSK
jgi:hypothetical protein